MTGSGLLPERALATRRNLTAVAMRSGYRLRITGVDRLPAWGPLLVVANHPSVVDAMVLVAATTRPLHVLEPDLHAVGPLLGTLDSLGRIPSTGEPVDRPALHTAVAALAEERAVAVFPEGRVGEGSVTSSDDVAGYLLARFPAPVVPVAVLGTRRGQAAMQSMPRWRATIDVVFGAPFTVTEVTGTATRADIARLSELVRQRLHDHVAEAVRRTGVALPTAPHHYDPSTREHR